MKKVKVMTVFGTRTEAIKMAPLVLELERQSDRFESVVVVTAQHRQMLNQVLEIFGIQPDYDLDVMKNQQTLAQITANVHEKRKARHRFSPWRYDNHFCSRYFGFL